MQKSKITKRALLASIISIAICFTMLVGSTFAWFTDSAKTDVNTIQSGTLLVELNMFDGENWTDATGAALNFDGGNDLWEPGASRDLPLLQVKNNGSLSLKYKLAITGLDGAAKLLEVIEFTATVDGVTTALDELTGELLASETSDDILITATMDINADNDYQDLSLDGISITLVATQTAAGANLNDVVVD